MTQPSIARRVVFGSHPKCDVVINDPHISPTHAEVYQDSDGAVWVQDLGSTNGTSIQLAMSTTPLTDPLSVYRNRIKVYGPTRIFPGDILWLGGRTQIPWTLWSTEPGRRCRKALTGTRCGRTPQPRCWTRRAIMTACRSGWPTSTVRESSGTTRTAGWRS